LNIRSRHVAAAALVAVLTGISAQGVWAKKAPEASPSPDASASAAPLPTATPEPPETAIPRLEAKVKANPDDRDSLADLAGYYLQEGKADQALPLTQHLLTLGVKTAQVYYLDGVADESLGRIKDATNDFEQATNLEPTNAQILLTLTQLYIQTNRAADADRVAKRATTFNPNDKRVLENYGLVLGQEGKFDDARTQFEAAAKVDPKDPLPIVLEARSYISQKAYALAGTEFDRALAIAPTDPDALLGKASVQANNHDVPGAIATFETLFGVEQTDDEKAAVLIQEFSLYRDEKMKDQAQAVLTRAEQAYPGVAAVHIAYGDYYVSMGNDRASAEREWRTALGPQRANPDALQRLGELALANGKKADALGYFKRLSEVVPNDPGVWSALGQMQSESGQYTDARDSYRRSFDLAQTPQALAGMGTADLQLRNYQECSKIFAAIDQHAPDFVKQFPQLLYADGKCAAGNGDTAQARSAFTRFKGFVKPGSQLALEIDKDISNLRGTQAKPAPKPGVKAVPKPSPKPSAKPSH
jgi:tetratricopeptide (TPR) repeat protein